MRRLLRPALKVTVSAGLLGWVAHTVLAHRGAGAVLAQLGALDGRLLALAAALSLAGLFAGVLRFRLLLEAQGLHVSLGFLVRTYLVGRFVGAFTPSTTGLDFYRAFAVGRRTGARARTAAAILVEKCLGLLALAILCFAVLPLGGRRLLGPVALWGAALLGVGSTFGLLVALRPGIVSGLGDRLPGRLGDRARALLTAFGARGLSPRTLGAGLALGFASHLSTASVFVAAALALGVSAPSGAVLVVGIAIVLSTLLPISVGGVGVREGVAVALLATVGVSAGDAVLVAFLGYLATQPPALLGGLISLLPATEPAARPELAPAPVPTP